MLTQTDIDTAVLKVKGMEYHLAWELAKESEFGGSITGCMPRLKLLYLWRRTLACQQKSTSAIGTLAISTFGGPPATRHITVFANGVQIGYLSTNSVDNVAWMQALTANINGAQAMYVAVYDSANQKIVITGPSYAVVLSETHNFVTATVSVTGFELNSVPANCLTDTQIQYIIGQINSLC